MADTVDDLVTVAPPSRGPVPRLWVLRAARVAWTLFGVTSIGQVLGWYHLQTVETESWTTFALGVVLAAILLLAYVGPAAEVHRWVRPQFSTAAFALLG